MEVAAICPFNNQQVVVFWVGGGYPQGHAPPPTVISLRVLSRLEEPGCGATSPPPQAWLNWALMSWKVGWQLLALTGASQQAVPVWHPPLDHSWEAKPHAGTSRLGLGLLGPHCFIFCLFTSALCSIPIAPSPSPSPSPLGMQKLGRGL